MAVLRHRERLRELIFFGVKRRLREMLLLLPAA